MDRKLLDQIKADAETGNSTAQLNLGLMYKNGNGVVKDPVQAVKYFRKAAEQGLAEAEHNLALCYGGGYGVVEDKAEMVRWYLKAAEKGFARATYNLGMCYRYGEGVLEDKAKAEKLFREAIEQGYRLYEDTIQGVIFDDQRNPFFVFVRTSTGPHKFLHVLAQRSNGDILIIQKVIAKGLFQKKFIITMQDQAAGCIEVVLQRIREVSEGKVASCFSAASARTESIGPDSLPEGYWAPLQAHQIQEWSNQLSKSTTQ